MKLIRCISANSSGFSLQHIAAIKHNHANHATACRAYKAANDYGVRPKIQRLITLLMIIETNEWLENL